MIGTTKAINRKWLVAFVVSIVGKTKQPILMPVSTATAKMLYRNLLYTAISRARKEVILVGSRGAVNTAMQCIPYPRKSRLVARTNLLRLRRSA